jgi:hypothetical protein
VAASPASAGASQCSDLEGDGKRGRHDRCDQNPPPLSHGDAYNPPTVASLRAVPNLWRP